MEIDFNQIFDGISLALHAAFPQSHIYGGTVKQGLQDGDFNVVPISTSEAAQIGNRAQRNASFDVIYYPSEERSREACLEVQNALPQALGMITTPNGDKLHCKTFECTITDDALHCIVSYPHFIFRQAESDDEDMQSAVITIN